jgi:hypothetical protein
MILSKAIRDEWESLLARRRKSNASGQDGRDFATWLQSRGVSGKLVQMELFA